MKWRRLITRLTASLLITLPLSVQGQQCVEHDWNQLLIEQKRLDSWYNQHAEAFNQFLHIYQQQVFLHKQFTKQQLRSFWAPNKPDLHHKMQQQIEISTQIHQLLTQEITLLENQSTPVEQLTQRWQTMMTSCKAAELNVNVLSSQTYIKDNTKLLEQLNLLTRKLKTLAQNYQHERQALISSQKQSEK